MKIITLFLRRRFRLFAYRFFSIGRGCELFERVVLRIIFLRKYNVARKADSCLRLSTFIVRAAGGQG